METGRRLYYYYFSNKAEEIEPLRMQDGLLWRDVRLITSGYCGTIIDGSSCFWYYPDFTAGNLRILRYALRLYL